MAQETSLARQVFAPMARSERQASRVIARTGDRTEKVNELSDRIYGHLAKTTVRAHYHAARVRNAVSFLSSLEPANPAHEKVLSELDNTFLVRLGQAHGIATGELVNLLQSLALDLPAVDGTDGNTWERLGDYLATH